MITLKIPENKSMFDIDKEITECQNIKDKENRNNTLRGLNKIKGYI
jgi:peptide subunit release factor 1 (eRF1)